MSTSAVEADAAEPGDECVTDHVPCRCGRMADVQLDLRDIVVVCAVRCACRAFQPADREERVR